MLSPQDLYKQYSVSPCTSNLESPYSQLSASEVFNQVSANEMGAGTPMNWHRIIQFLKQVKYPCVYDTPTFDRIKDSGQGSLALPYKFLQDLDAEAYLERQPTVRAGTAHSVRNACDLARACMLHAKDSTDQWIHRMATEYIEHFAHNSLPDCLMMCGPDLVHDVIAGLYRGPGKKVSAGEQSGALGGYNGASSDDPDGFYIDQAMYRLGGMLCIPNSPRGAAGGAHGCATYPEDDGGPYCDSCPECPRNPVTGEVMNPSHPCCNPGSIYYINECCGGGYSSRLDFSYWVPSDDGSFNGTIYGGRIGEILKHVGILQRKSYGGYANFSNQCSGREPPIILKDMFLKRFQKSNGWDYDKNQTKKVGEEDDDIVIDRARTISLILDATVGRQGTTVTNATNMLNTVKDLLFNGYGVLLLSNVGFPNARDSTGVAYPDRIFYQTYNIIGFDDTKVESDQTLYILHCPFGNWISGGNPYWGELPPGCFIVTEDRLKCMIDYYPGADFYGCRKKPCPEGPPDYCNNYTPGELEEINGCGGGYENQCDPYYCTKIQQANGLLFAISLNDGFPRQSLNHDQFYPITLLKKLISESDKRGSN
jgi:hypothetical protein